jgi:hypothetical protein
MREVYIQASLERFGIPGYYYSILLLKRPSEPRFGSLDSNLGALRPCPWQAQLRTRTHRGLRALERNTKLY